MSTRAYQQNEWQRPDATDDPWLEDKTTVPYRASSQLYPSTPRGAQSFSTPIAAARRHVALPPPPIDSASAATPEHSRVSLAMTPEQLSHTALEEYWRLEDERRARLHRVKALRWRTGIALLCLALGYAIYRSPQLQQVSRPSVVAAVMSKLSVECTTQLARMQAFVAGIRGEEAASSEPTKPAPTPLVGRDNTASTQPGTLCIDSQPVAQVFVDDVRIGNTPQRDIGLPPGAHSLRLYDAKHVLLRDITLSVQPGENISRVEYLDH